MSNQPGSTRLPRRSSGWSTPIEPAASMSSKCQETLSPAKVIAWSTSELQRDDTVNFGAAGGTNGFDEPAERRYEVRRPSRGADTD